MVAVVGFVNRPDSKKLVFAIQLLHNAVLVTTKQLVCVYVPEMTLLSVVVSVVSCCDYGE